MVKTWIPGEKTWILRESFVTTQTWIRGKNMYNRKKCKKQTTQIFPLRKSDHFPPKPSTNRISQTSKTKTHFQKTDPFCQNRCRTAVPTRKIQTFHQKTGDPNRGDPLRKIESHTALLREGSQREREIPGWWWELRGSLLLFFFLLCSSVFSKSSLSFDRAKRDAAPGLPFYRVWVFLKVGLKFQNFWA